MASGHSSSDINYHVGATTKSRSSLTPLQEIEQQIGRAPSKQDAFDLVMAEVEKSMARLEVSKDKTERAYTSRLINRAEHIKTSQFWRSPLPVSEEGPVSRRTLTTAEQIIVLKASYVNGGKYPPWQTNPTATDFELGPDGKPFEDDHTFNLSRTQQESLSCWKRAADALPSAHDTPDLSENDLRWSTDLVQDATTNCSVVAGLCAAVARLVRGCSPLLAHKLYPYDFATWNPTLSPNGKYIAKFNFNGAFRRVVIDDRLPVSKSQRLIHVIDRHNPNRPFPALLEKLYLKIFGGYDFPGSNSSTDLWILFGWIPEQVFFSSHEESLSETWRRIWQSHGPGDVMITLGTGKLSPQVERQTGLAGQHSYAVLDLREDDGQMLMLVKNPWCRGQMWKTNRLTDTSKDSIFADSVVASPRDLLNADENLSPGTFWMDIYNVSQQFDCMYLNWNPTLFKFREDVHFAWDLEKSKSRRTFIDSPQFVLTTPKGGSVWLLLCRHILDGDYATADQPASTDTWSGGYIGISVYDSGGHSVDLKGLPIQDSALVDSSQTLLRVSNLRPGVPFTVVPNEDRLPHPRHTFTLSVFSDHQISIDRAVGKFKYSVELPGTWDQWTGGGSTESPFFCINPQYHIEVTQPTALSLLLCSRQASIPMNVKICVSNGGRVQSLRRRDIMADSGTYRANAAEVQVRELVPGKYTIVCSTFEQKQWGDFWLRLNSDIPIPMVKMDNEAAGRFRAKVSPAIFGSEQQACALLLLPQKLTQFICVVRSTARVEGSPRHERSMIRVSIVKGDHLQYQPLTVSCDGDFMDAFGGVRTDEIRVDPNNNAKFDVWLLIERRGSAKDNEEEEFTVEFFTETKHAVQTGDWQDWEL